MLTIPAIDLQGGRCVRLLHGRFDAATEYGEPRAQIAAFAAAGADWVHVVDLDGARTGAPRQHALIGDLASAGVKLQCGGGVRTREHAQALLEAGAARVVVGSAALARPEEVRGWIEDFGAERICLALDLRGEEVQAQGWQTGAGLTLEAALDLYPPGAARHVLVTDVSRDGALVGPNVALMRRLSALRPDLAFQASGGVASLEDLRALSAAGASACIIGRALYERRFTLEDALAL